MIYAGFSLYLSTSGDGNTPQSYYQGLEGRSAEVGRDSDGIIACCQRKVGQKGNSLPLCHARHPAIKQAARGGNGSTGNAKADGSN
jgi:hypothetical protein